MAQQAFIPTPGESIRLADYDPAFTAGFDKKRAADEMAALHTRLNDLQERLYAEDKQALLVILQGMDTSGKDGAIKKVFDPIDPQGAVVTNFKAPTVHELARDFLWRVHQAVPPKGMIGIFNRSHYEDVLVVRVDALVAQAVWERRYDQINAFERMLTESGTRVLKFFLHISKDEQKERLQARLDDPSKHWKFSLGDLPVREKWDEYMRAYEDALTRCNTEYAPWVIVPANKKWHRDLVITRTIVETLEAMNPQFPTPAADLGKVVIPD